MVELKISRRYARALFELARDQGVLEPTGEQLEVLAQVLQGHPDAAQFLQNTFIDVEAKRRFLEPLVSRLGSSDLLQRFVGLLLTRGRASLLPEVARQYREMAEEHLGVLSAEVETARPLGATAHARLEQSLSRYTGKTVQLSERVRPELIAGLRVQLGSLLIDGTLERQLSELNRAMLS